MTDHDDPKRAASPAGERIEPAGTNAAQGTPRPDTKLSAGRGDAREGNQSILDPDYGIDPSLPTPMYGGTGRGSDDTIAQASSHRTAVEGNDRPDSGRGSTAGGTARGGDTTSTADTFSDTRHGLGESGVRGHMDAGVNTPGVAGRRPAPPDDIVDPNDESTFEEGMQHADGSRA